MSPTSVDLFAGCGGLSLGLEESGFETVFVNEIHPKAMETFVRNRPGSLVELPRNQVLDILEVTRHPDQLKSLARRLRNEHGDIDAVVGGPPCQGFSGIGHRRSFNVTKEEVPSNHLYREMANFVQAVGPRSFVFENVAGLLRGKWTPGGESGEIWQDVLTTFEQIQFRRGRKLLTYAMGWQLVQAKDYGVPQSRPRVLLVGIRSDVNAFVDPGGVGGGFLPSPSMGAPGLVQLMGDLVDPKWAPGGSTKKYRTDPKTEVQERLRLSPSGKRLRKGDVLTEQDYSRHRPEIVAKFEFMLANNGEIPTQMRTKKFAQRVLPSKWGPKGPTITLTSLPDDYVHFSQPRTPTVREWARIQTFPDWYQFSGGRTTGGRRRAGDPSLGDWSRDLPKYTQIGNAVPVALGRAIGEHLLKLVAS